jgi:hypothetical protein
MRCVLFRYWRTRLLSASRHSVRSSSSCAGTERGGRWPSPDSVASRTAATSFRRRRAPPSPSPPRRWCVASLPTSRRRGLTSLPPTVATLPTPACARSSPNRPHSHLRPLPALQRSRRRLRNLRGRGWTAPSFISAPSVPTYSDALAVVAAPSGASTPPASRPRRAWPSSTSRSPRESFLPPPHRRSCCSRCEAHHPLHADEGRRSTGVPRLSHACCRHLNRRSRFGGREGNQAGEGRRPPRPPLPICGLNLLLVLQAFAWVAG